MSEKEVTESWKDKIYELKLTDQFFETDRILRDCGIMPVLPNIKKAFSYVKGLAYSTVYSKYYMDKFKTDLEPILKDIENILYGSNSDYSVRMTMKKYRVKIETNRHGKVTVENAQNIISQLWDIYFIIKQFAYDMGFFVTKPFSRSFGTEAMEDAFSQ